MAALPRIPPGHEPADQGPITISVSVDETFEMIIFFPRKLMAPRNGSNNHGWPHTNKEAFDRRV
jgi:hypothetical protein